MAKPTGDDDFIQKLRKKSEAHAHEPRMVLNKPPSGESKSLLQMLADEDSSNAASAAAAEVAAKPTEEHSDIRPQERGEIPVENIRPSKYQPRIVFDDEYIENLSENIKDIGLNQPIVVRPLENGDYELIAGENRLKAFKLLNRKTIPAVIRTVDDNTAAKTSLADNLQRKDITDYEIFKALKIIRDEGIETTISGMARLIGRDRKLIRLLFSFETLPASAIEVLEKRPSILGATIASELSIFASTEHANLIAETLGLIASGKLTQMRAPSWISHRIGQNVRRKASRPVQSSDGTPVATLKRDGSELRIRCLPGIDVEKYEQLLIDALTKAKAFRSETSDA